MSYVARAVLATISFGTGKYRAPIHNSNYPQSIRKRSGSILVDR